MTSDLDAAARGQIAAVPPMTAAGWRRYAAVQLGWAAQSENPDRVREDIFMARVYLRAAELLEGDNDHQ